MRHLERLAPRRLALAGGLFLCSARELSTSTPRPPWLPEGVEALSLGQVRVTQYTHVECASRLTSSGYTLRDSDEGLVCAVSRDWWRSLVRPGDLLWVEGFASPCVALDTMALRNPKGLPQTRWVDIYVTDPARGLAFGIRRDAAYRLRPDPARHPHLDPKALLRDPAPARGS